MKQNKKSPHTHSSEITVLPDTLANECRDALVYFFNL